MRGSAKEGDEVTIVGRIGGDVKPWIDGQAAFMLVDSKLKPCNEQGDDGCATPWDYCCDLGELPALGVGFRADARRATPHTRFAVATKVNVDRLVGAVQREKSSIKLLEQFSNQRRAASDLETSSSQVAQGNRSGNVDERKASQVERGRRCPLAREAAGLMKLADPRLKKLAFKLENRGRIVVLDRGDS